MPMNRRTAKAEDRQDTCTLHNGRQVMRHTPSERRHGKLSLVCMFPCDLVPHIVICKPKTKQHLDPGDHLQ